MLDACAQGAIQGITGDLTLAELLVLPLRQNNAAAVAAVRELLIENGAITLLPHDRATFEPVTPRPPRLCASAAFG